MRTNDYKCTEKETKPESNLDVTHHGLQGGIYCHLIRFTKSDFLRVMYYVTKMDHLKGPLMDKNTCLWKIWSRIPIFGKSDLGNTSPLKEDNKNWMHTNSLLRQPNAWIIPYHFDCTYLGSFVNRPKLKKSKVFVSIDLGCNHWISVSLWRTKPK